MVIDVLPHLESYAALFTGDTISRLVSLMRGGIHSDQIGTTISLDGEALQARVMKVNTRERGACRYETHRDHADVQCIFDGREIIDWIPQSKLTAAGAYDAAHDVQFYLPHDAEATLEMRSGLFAVFFPEDAHRPQIVQGGADFVTKIVFKVHRSRWGRSAPLT